MAIVPTFKPDVKGMVRGAVRSANSATGGIVGKVGERLGFKDSSGTPSRLRDGSLSQESRIGGNGLKNSIANQWGGLNDNYIARIFAVDKEFNEIVSEGMVLGPITDSNFEASLNWQSPFENSGPEAKAPAIMAMIQTGQIATIANALQVVLPENAGGKIAKDVAGNAKDWARDLEGRTGITRLNSRQVFSGMPPIKVTFTLHLRAMNDARTQVEEPFRKLLEWALPAHLAADGVLAELIGGDDGFIKSMFPSSAPQLVGMVYGRQRLAPMVIESIGKVLDGQMTPDGYYTYKAVQLTLATLTALDRADVKNIYMSN